MAEAGIATNVHYKPIPMHTAYKNLGFTIDDYPNAYNQFKNEITLPLSYIANETKKCNISLKHLKGLLPNVSKKLLRSTTRVAV